MYPKTKEQFDADCQAAQALAWQKAKQNGKSEWMVEYEGVQYFFSAEIIP